MKIDDLGANDVVLSDYDEDFEVEIIDDTPEEDRVPKRDPSAVGDDDFDSDPDDLGNIGDKTKKRINRLRYEFNEQRRAKESAERERDEAITYAKSAREFAERTRKNLVDGEKVLLNEIKSKTDHALQIARAKYKQAFEEGEADNLIAAQEELNKAQFEKQQAEMYRPPADVERPEFQPQPQQHRETAEWKNRNQWFGKDESKTSYAAAYARSLEKQGVSATGDPSKYFGMIDQEMRARFPEVYKDSATNTGVSEPAANGKSKSVVAHGSRTSGNGKSKVQLTETERKTASRLGISEKDYAREKLKFQQTQAARS